MLKQSKVIFYPETHTYLLGEKRLQGVTGVISRNIFPDKYSDVPEFVLQRAAQKGSEIHASCEASDLFGICSTKEAENYQNLKKEYGIITIANEYLVSDEENYATMVDIVGDDYSLYDIKTTASLDIEYLSWQLSINAVLFEMQNPNLRVNKLFGIWLRNDKAKLIEVQRIDDETIKNLLFCDANGLPFEYLPVIADEVNDSLVKLSQLEEIIQIAEAEIKATKAKQDAIKDFLLKKMKESGVKKWETENIVVSYVLPSTRETIDSKSLKEQKPEIWQKYAKTSEIKEQIRIKVK